MILWSNFMSKDKEDEFGLTPEERRVGLTPLEKITHAGPGSPITKKKNAAASLRMSSIMGEAMAATNKYLKAEIEIVNHGLAKIREAAETRLKTSADAKGYEDIVEALEYIEEKRAELEQKLIEENKKKSN